MRDYFELAKTLARAEGERVMIHVYRPIGNGYCWVCGESYFLHIQAQLIQQKDIITPERLQELKQLYHYPDPSNDDGSWGSFVTQQTIHDIHVLLKTIDALLGKTV